MVALDNKTQRCCMTACNTALLCMHCAGALADTKILLPDFMQFPCDALSARMIRLALLARQGQPMLEDYVKPKGQ